MLYLYRAVKSTGKRCFGLLLARTRYRALRGLLTRSLCPLWILEFSFFKKIGFGKTDAFKFSQKDVLFILDYLRGDLQDGRTLMNSLKSLNTKVLSEAQKKILADVWTQLHSGKFFYEAITPYLEIRYVKILQCAELGGYLKEGLEEVCEEITLYKSLNRSWKIHMIYPGVVALFLIILFVLLNILVLPNFYQYLSQQTYEFTGLTAYFFKINTFFNTHICWFLGLMFLAFLSLFNVKVRGFCKRIILHIPWISRMWQMQQYGIFAKNLSALLKHGIHVKECIRLSAACFPEGLLSVEEVEQKLNNGDSLSQALNGLPSSFVEGVRVAENMGNFTERLDQLAEHYFSRYREGLKQWVRWFEPLCLVGLAGIIIFVALAVFVPILQIFQHFD